MSTNTDITTISDQYKAFYNGTNTKTFNTFASDSANRNYTLTEDIDLQGNNVKTSVTSKYTQAAHGLMTLTLIPMEMVQGYLLMFLIPQVIFL